MLTEPPDIPSLTCREKSRAGGPLGVMAALNGFAWVMALGLGLSIPVAVALGLVSATSLGLTFRAWWRRRIALRVDSAGLHEVFADGRTVTHLWAELQERSIDELWSIRWARFCRKPLWGPSEELSSRAQRPPRFLERLISCLYGGEATEAYMDMQKALEADVGVFGSSSGRVVINGSALENGRGLVSLIRTVLRGEKPVAPPKLPAPSATEIAGWLGVTATDLPVTFSGWGRQTLVGLVGAALCVLSLWGHNLSMGQKLAYLGIFLLTGMMGILTAWFRVPYIKVDAEGLSLRRALEEREQRCPWRDLIGQEGWILRGRYRDFIIPPSLRDRDRLRALIQKVLDTRGELPPGALEPGLPIPDTALSRTPPPGQPAPDERSLSQTKPGGETKPRLTGEETVDREAVQAVHEWKPE